MTNKETLGSMLLPLLPLLGGVFGFMHYFVRNKIEKQEETADLLILSEGAYAWFSLAMINLNEGNFKRCRDCMITGNNLADRALNSVAYAKRAGFVFDGFNGENHLVSTPEVAKEWIAKTRILFEDVTKAAERRWPEVFVEKKDDEAQKEGEKDSEP